MPEFHPVSTLQDLAGLDLDDMGSGYDAGFSGQPEPSASTYSRSYVHGWRVGRVNAGIERPDAAIRQLDYAFESQPPWIR